MNTKKNHQNKIILILIVMIGMGFMTDTSYAKVVESELGTVHEVLISDDGNLYFFEQDNSIKFPTWIHDTKIMLNNINGTFPMSENLFIYPTEIHEYDEYLYFATLSETCVGQVTCDYQDIIRMSKDTGNTEKIREHLKSAIHLSIRDNIIYFSESSGQIWKMNLDGSNPQILYEGKNIIMDIETIQDTVFWIEEISDENNTIFELKPEQESREIKTGLQLPYGLSTYESDLYWKEIHVGPVGSTVKEFTKIAQYNDDKIKYLIEFENTTPISKFNMYPHYGTYFVFGNHVLVSNNTSGNPTIQVVDTKNNMVLDIAEIDTYDIKYIRSNSNYAYAIGVNEDGFIIDKFTLPHTIPEFSSGIVFLGTIASLGLIVFWKKFSHYEIQSGT